MLQRTMLESAASMASDGEDMDLSSLAGLRSSFQRHRKLGAATWIRLDGLTVDDAASHSALCHTLTRLGLGGDHARKSPKIVVFDWSGVGGCSAEGLAFFVVLVGHLT